MEDIRKQGVEISKTRFKVDKFHFRLKSEREATIERYHRPLVSVRQLAQHCEEKIDRMPVYAAKVRKLHDDSRRMKLS